MKPPTKFMPPEATPRTQFIILYNYQLHHGMHELVKTEESHLFYKPE